MIDLPNSLILGICHLIFYFYGYKDHLDRCTPSLDLFAKLLQLCLTLYNPMDYSPPGFSVHGILQARILEWVAISFSRASSRPRDPTEVPHISARRFNRFHLQFRRPRFDSWVGKISWRRDRLPTLVFLGFSCGSAGNESACNAGDTRDVGSIPGFDPLEEEIYTHSSILAWRIPCTEESGGLQSLRLQSCHD